MKIHTTAVDALNDAAKMLVPSARSYMDLDLNNLLMEETNVTTQYGEVVRLEIFLASENCFKRAEVYYREEDLEEG
jgi:hypothetical protein